MRIPSFSRGQVLVEVLIALSIVGAIGAIVVSLGLVSIRSSEVAGERTVMVNLAQEGVDAAEAIARADWHDVYGLTGERYPKIAAGAWTLTTDPADKTVTINNVNYSRWIIVDNVSRDAQGDIEATYNGTNDDPSTQKITVTVTATGAKDVSMIRFLTRATNTTASQDDWSGGSGQGDNPTSGFDANFNTQFDTSTGIDFGTVGEIKLEAQ